MHVKSTIPALAAGLLMTQGAMAENYRWDNVDIAIGDSYQWVAGGFSNVALLTIAR